MTSRQPAKTAARTMLTRQAQGIAQPNAFNSVRPRALEAPSKPPKRRNHSKAPMSGPIPQPPGYRQVTSVKESPASPPVNERLASYVLREAQNDRSRKGGAASIFGRNKE